MLRTLKAAILLLLVAPALSAQSMMIGGAELRIGMSREEAQKRVNAVVGPKAAIVDLDSVATRTGDGAERDAVGIVTIRSQRVCSLSRQWRYPAERRIDAIADFAQAVSAIIEAGGGAIAKSDKYNTEDPSIGQVTLTFANRRMLSLCMRWDEKTFQLLEEVGDCSPGKN